MYGFERPSSIYVASRLILASHLPTVVLPFSKKPVKPRKSCSKMAATSPIRARVVSSTPSIRFKTSTDMIPATACTPAP